MLHYVRAARHGTHGRALISGWDTFMIDASHQARFLVALS